MSEILHTLYVVGPLLGCAIVFGWCVYRIFLAIFLGDE